MGGKRNQKKKKKKSWRAMLDGCFHKPSFDRTDSQDSKDIQDIRDIPDTSHTAAPQPKIQSALPTANRQVHEAEVNREPEGRADISFPVRGILKKSPTSSSCNSGPTCPDSTSSGIIYYNPIYTDVSSNRSWTTQDGDSSSNSYECCYQGAIPKRVVSMSISNRQPQPQQRQFHSTGPDCQINRNAVVVQQPIPRNHNDDGRKIAESWEDWKAGFLEKQDPYNLPRGVPQQNIDNSNYSREGHPKTHYAPRQQRISPQENRWSFPVCLPNVATTSNLYLQPTTHSTGIYSSPVSPSHAQDIYARSAKAIVPYDPHRANRLYKSAFVQQQHQHHSHHHQQHSHRHLDGYGDNFQLRSLSSSPASRQNAPALPPQNRARHVSECSSTLKPITNTMFNHQSHQHNPSNASVPVKHKDYETIYPSRPAMPMTVSRMYDPIRKPMGSHFCPYANPIYGIHGAVPTKERGQRRRQGVPTAAHSNNIYGIKPSESDGAEYNVSQIYATVCRSGSNSVTSSCVYTSFSWQKSTGNGDVAMEPPPLPPNRFHPISPPIPPPIPPPILSLPLPIPPGDDIDSSGPQTDPPLYSRPPLPSYDEFIRTRNQKKGSRPSSWCEADIKETEKKKEAFMSLLAQRYPQYADRIQGGIPVSAQPAAGVTSQPASTQSTRTLEKPARSRDAHRRRPGPAVVYDHHRQANNSFEYDDLGTMSDLELPSFQRGGMMRSSMPIVRSASTSLERPLGLVFLVHGNQTKKSLLPNELTTLDTVRALFVRAFPDLNMEMMEFPRRKIYLLDPATNIYFQLEDLGEIKDRSVLKLHETNDDIPQKVRERQEVRGITVQMPLSRPLSRQAHAENPEYSKAHTLPPPQNFAEPDQYGQRDMERRSRSRTPEPMERPRSLSAGASSRHRYPQSPEHFPPPERGAGGGSLNPIPENRQVNPRYREPQYETIGPHSPNGNYNRPNAYSQSAYDSQNPYAIYSAPPQQQAYIARSTRASTMVHPQRAVGPTPTDMREGTRGVNPNSRHPPAFVQGPMTQANEPIYQRSHSQTYRPPPVEKDAEFSRSLSTMPQEEHRTKNRIEKMEQQLASLTAWVHYQKADLPGQRKEAMNGHRSLGSTTSDSSDTFPASSASKQCEEINPPLSSLAPTNHLVSAKGLSDIPDGQRPSAGIDSQRAASVSPASSVAIPPEISGQLATLKADLQVLRRQTQVNVEAMREEFLKAAYSIKTVISSVPGADNQLIFHNRIEATKLKTLYVSDKVQVDQELSDLESSVEELRNDIINHQCRVQLSDVEGMALLLSSITKSLADLKTQFPYVHEQMKSVMNIEMQQVVAEEKLASVQDHRPPQIPNIASTVQSEPAEVDPKKTLLENIRALVPDHDRRVHQLEAREAARERKKKISTQQEALKFGKTLEMATKTLRPCSTNDVRGEEAGDIKKETVVRFEMDNNGVQEAPITSCSQGSVSAKPSISQPQFIQNASAPSSSSSSLPSAASSSTYSSSSSSSPSVTFATSVSYTSSVAPTVETAPVPTGPAVKPLSFSTSLGQSNKSSEKPTATVSAMTSTSTEIPQSVTSTLAPAKPPHANQSPTTTTSIKSATLPLTEMTERLTSQVQTGNGPVAHSVSTSTESSKKSNASVSTVTTTSETTSSSFRPPVFTKPPRLFSPSRSNSTVSRTAPLVESEIFDQVKERPKSSGAPISSSSKTPPVTKANSLDSSPSKPYRPITSPSSDTNGHSPSDEEKSKYYKKAARSAFSSSWVSPPSSPVATSPNTSSSSIAQVTPGGTINLVLSGVVSPKSPTSPGTFTIVPPTEITTDATGQPTTAPSVAKSPAPPSPAQQETETAGNKQKKVPPPPPPRKGSRPTSMTNFPVINGGEQEQEVPQFVGGILGQHRLSGGPLSSTPKTSQQRALSTFEKDIASGIYANLNRPDLQNQNSTPQQMMNKANPPNKNIDGKEISDVPAPLVSTTCVDRTERGSSSESTSSSNSGTSSMGSQQSMVNVMRSASVSMRSPSNKTKPEPPKRHSSLIAKAPPPVTNTRVPSRRKTLNGVDL